MAEESILKTLKRAIELAMPDFRHYYRMTKKAKIVASYASDGQYFADVQPLRNDESEDANEPVIPHVEIPIMWGGPQRGIVCPPAVGTLCDLSYYDGDPNYPRISNFRWQGNQAPQCELEELIIQKSPEVFIKIDKDDCIITITPRDWTVKIEGNATIECQGSITLKAPQIVQQGNVTTTGAGGGKASIQQKGDINLEGNITVSGNISCSGTSYAASRSGAPI